MRNDRPNPGAPFQDDRFLEEDAPLPAPPKGTIGPLSLPKMLVMYMVTGGLYVVYWYYRAQKVLRQQALPNISPRSRTIGFLLPLYNLFLLFRLFGEEMEALRQSVAGQIFLRNPWAPLAEFVGLSLLWALPSPYRFLGLLAFLPLRGVQHVINLYLQRVPGNLPEERAYTGVEIFVLIVGGLAMMWLLGGAAMGFVARVLNPDSPVTF